MQILFLVLCLFFGIVVILKSGDLLIDGAINISHNTGASEQFIGLTLLSFATTAPELCVSCISAIQGRAEMCVNNGLGSIICNIGLVLAISLIAITQTIKREEFNFKSITLLFVFVLLFCLCINNTISKLEGFVLVSLYIAFIIINIFTFKRDKNVLSSREKINIKELLFSIFIFLLGAIGVGLSANMLVNVSVKLATLLNISEGIIAITVLALGTALPELVSTLTAIKKKTLELALGNIVGANIMNGLVLIGLSAILSPSMLSISMQTKFITIPFCIFFNFILILPILKWRKTFKFQGFLMLFLFIVYYFLIFLI